MWAHPSDSFFTLKKIDLATSSKSSAFRPHWDTAVDQFEAVDTSASDS